MAAKLPFWAIASFKASFFGMRHQDFCSRLLVNGQFLFNLSWRRLDRQECSSGRGIGGGEAHAFPDLAMTPAAFRLCISWNL